MFDVRLFFSKTQFAAHLSHLDLMRVMQRVICRAQLPARYTLGFNPHIVLSLPAPLSTGYQGLNEPCDFSMESEMDFSEIVRRMDAAMPAGMRALSAAAPVKKPAAIAWSDYEIILPPGDVSAMRELFSAPLEMEKRSKRGVKPVNLLDYIMDISFSEADGKTKCRAVLRADTDPLNPSYITAALITNGLICGDLPASYIRHAILDENAQIFY